MVRWWWFGPAVATGELERELRTMKEGGIGGVEVQPVYPLELDNPETGIRNLPYLSDGFIDALRFTGEKTHELDLRFDLTLGSGWPFGGPHIPITQAAGRLRIERVPVPAGATSAPVPERAPGETLIATFPDPGRANTSLVFIASHTRMMVKRAAAGALVDRKPGGTAVHALRPEEVDAILGLAGEWGEIDGSHRKLAHRGSYLGRVWVSPSTVLRVLLEHGRALPWRAPRQKSLKRPWPEWVQYKPCQVWGYDFSEFPRAGTSALAILDLVSRKWIETMLCPEATDVQVQVLFTRALEREGLLDVILSLIDELGEDDELQPILLSVSDNGAQMRSGSTREFMALHAIATHYGRPGTPTDQAHIESLFGHVKYEWPYLCALQDPADLSRELDAVREQYNRVRLHAGVGYVTPDDEHEGRGPAIRQARRAGLARAREQRLAYNRGTHPRLIG